MWGVAAAEYHKPEFKCKVSSEADRMCEREMRKKICKRVSDESFRDDLMRCPSVIFCLIKYNALTRATAAGRQKCTKPKFADLAEKES